MAYAEYRTAAFGMSLGAVQDLGPHLELYQDACELGGLSALLVVGPRLAALEGETETWWLG